MIKNKRQKNAFFNCNFFQKNRKGSHVSFIISFILFISFLIFFIGVIKPFEKTESGKSSLLKHLENEIIKNVAEDVEVISVIEKIGGSNDCFDIKNEIINGKENVVLKNNGLEKIYLSNEFTSLEFSCSNEKYEVGLIRTQKYIFQSKILKLNQSYEDDYETLKSEFGIPETNDFEFSFLDDSKIPITESKFKKEIPSTETLAELIPIIYFNENLEIENGYIKVILW
ncbi:MAG: hypothetical protein QT10_C0010G0011 [archaeon GW2011_AR19]|nr:MAG: hypothetical protein QT10_C0010G0011 [archaeon GW2011_AR19]